MWNWSWHKASGAFSFSKGGVRGEPTWAQFVPGSKKQLLIKKILYPLNYILYIFAQLFSQLHAESPIKQELELLVTRVTILSHIYCKWDRLVLKNKMHCASPNQYKTRFVSYFYSNAYSAFSHARRDHRPGYGDSDARFWKNVGELKSAFKKKKKKKMSANVTSSSPPVKRERSCRNTDLNGRRTTSWSVLAVGMSAGSISVFHSAPDHDIPAEDAELLSISMIWCFNPQYDWYDRAWLVSILNVLYIHA